MSIRTIISDSPDNGGDAPPPPPISTSPVVVNPPPLAPVYTPPVITVTPIPRTETTTYVEYSDPKAPTYIELGDNLANLALYLKYMVSNPDGIADEGKRCANGVANAEFDGKPNSDGSLTFKGTTVNWHSLKAL